MRAPAQLTSAKPFRHSASSDRLIAGHLQQMLIREENLKFRFSKKAPSKIFFNGLPKIFKIVHIDVAHLNCTRGDSEGVIEPLAIMARRACTFKQRDVTRALRAASAAGLHVSRVEFDANGNFGLVTGPSNTSSHDQDDLDRELEEFRKRNGKS